MSPGDQSHSQDQDTVTVCREVFDTEASQPTDKGIVSVTASSRCSVQWPVSRLRDDSFYYRLIFMFCKTLSSHKQLIRNHLYFVFDIYLYQILQSSRSTPASSGSTLPRRSTSSTSRGRGCWQSSPAAGDLGKAP